MVPFFFVCLRVTLQVKPDVEKDDQGVFLPVVSVDFSFL